MGIDIQAGDVNIGFSSEGQLSKLLKPGLDWVLHFGDKVAALCAAPGLALGDVPEGSIEESINTPTPASWLLGSENLIISCSAGQSGRIRFSKEGTLVSYLDGDAQPFDVAVPSGCVYVSLEFEVNFEVAGGLAFSSQGFGVKGDLSQADVFTVANHRCFPATCKLLDALRQVFERFTLPFQSQGILALGDNDLVDFQFIGKLELGFGLTYGFEGALLCGRSAGEISRSLVSNKLASATIHARPAFSVGAKFAATYDHQDAFRFVFARSTGKPGAQTSLTILRMDKREFSTKFTSGISLTPGLQLDLTSHTGNAVHQAVDRLFDQVGPATSGASGQKLKDKLTNAGSAAIKGLADAGTASVNDFFDKLSGKAGIEVLHEKTLTNTTLFQLVFDLADKPAAEAAIQLAMHGRIAQAALAPGVTLQPGSMMERESQRQTAFTFQFFDLWKWQDVDQYIENVDVIYTGNKTLRLLATTGVKHSSGIVGHDSSCDVFFRAEARESVAEASVDDLTVAFHFELLDRNRSSLLETTRALTVLASDALSEAASRIQDRSHNDLSGNQQLSVKTSCVLSERAFGNLAVDRYIGNKPPAMPHENDALNYQRFAKAVQQVSDSWLGFATYNEWATFNRTATDQDGSTKLPDRRNRGNLACWPSAFASPSDPAQRQLRKFSSDSARTFMNVCDDLELLHEHLDQSKTEAAFESLLKGMNDIIKEVPASFLKATLVALIWCTGSEVQNVAVGLQGEDMNLSFRADTAEMPARAASSQAN